MIDKIDGLGGVRTTQPVRRPVKTGAAGGAGFAKHLDESSEAGATHGVAAAGAVGVILGVQEVDDALAHASKGKLRAQDILDRLDDMRMQLLEGGLSQEKLQQLARVVATRRAGVTDPRLAGILDEIDLRAQVELAKYAP